MKNLKFILGFAGFGFVLSFISGLFSGSSFGLILVHAIIFAVVFAILGFGVSFLYDKFISTDSSEPSITENAPEQKVSGKSNHAVDIVLQSEELPQDENSQQFFVGQPNMLNSNDVSTSQAEVPSVTQTQAAPSSNSADDKTAIHSLESLDSLEEQVSNNNTAAGNSGFVPMPLAETASNLSGTEAKTVAEVKNEERRNKNSLDEEIEKKSSDDSEDLDSLPDLEDLPQQQSVVPTTEEQMVEDSDFSKNGVPSKDADEIAKGKDAALMAKAISTLLSKE